MSLAGTVPSYIPAHVDHLDVTRRISAPPLRRKTSRQFLMALTLAFSLFVLFMYAIAYLVLEGVGIWGINQPVAWGFAIINFVWWIGIGHAGTLISAILLLLRQDWRMSISRFAEAMTLFAVACAGLFPLLHLGRIWKFYYILPYPSVMDTWPQFRSPLVWDVFAISTYATVSLLFWYTGLVPDLATMRDRAQRKWVKVIYGIFALGWRSSARHWHRHQTAYLLLAGLATPLVISVHSVVSLDFATAILPGWHTTVFPPYFVAGAIYCGFAMVLVLVIPVRRIYRFKDLITDNHLDVMGKVMLVSGLVVAYGYFMEIFVTFYGGHDFETSMTINRMSGAYAPAYWSMLACNVLIPQALWSRRVRRSAGALFTIAIVINIGMWLERYVIVVTSLHHDYLPSSWGMFFPTFWDWATLAGSFGLFFTLLLLFIRVVPMISMSEVRELVSHHSDDKAADPSPPRDGPAEEAHDERSAASDGEIHEAAVVAPPADAIAQTIGGAPVPPEAVLAHPAAVSRKLYGLLAEFSEEKPLRSAATKVRDAGYTRFDAYSPYPSPRLHEAMRLRRSRVPLIVAAGAVLGALAGYGLEYWTSAVDYPINVGGRPFNSWPMFVPVTFECAVLVAAIAATFGMFALNRLPRPHHPLFEMPRFERASQDKFFLCIEAVDAQFDADATRRLLETIGATEVSEVYV